jgi:hypothetical protein
MVKCGCGLLGYWANGGERTKIRPFALNPSGERSRYACHVGERSFIVSRKGGGDYLKTLEEIRGIRVMDQKAVVREGKITEFRVDMKVTFILK